VLGPILANVQRPNLLAIGFVVLACALIAILKFDFLFAKNIIQWADYASNDILIIDAKRFALFHGNYSRVGFYHPGPFYLQWMAIVELLFFDLFRIFASPHAAHAFATAFLHVLAYGLYFRLLHLWFGRIWVATVAVLVTFAVTASGTPSGFILQPWAPFLYIASTLLAITGLLGMIVRGPTWLPLLVFGLGQLLHGHASFIGIIPLMLVVGVVTANAFGRLPLSFFSFRRIQTFARINWGPLILSAAIIALFLLPIVLQTIFFWPGEIPKYFSFAGRLHSHTATAAATYVTSLIPGLGLWMIALLIPPRFYPDEAQASEARFAAVLLLAVGCLTAWFYAWRGIDTLDDHYLIFWVLPFIGTALAVTIVLVASFFQGAWRALFVVVALGLSLNSIHHYPLEEFSDVRSPGPRMSAALNQLSNKVPSGSKIAVRRGIKSEWGDLVSLLALMNRENRNFLCVEPESWILLFHARYRCTASDNISGVLYFTNKASILGRIIVELPETFVISMQAPNVGVSVRGEDLSPFLAEGWSHPEPWGIWSEGPAARMFFDTTALPKRFTVEITARLFPDDQSVRISDGTGQTLAVISKVNPANPIRLNINRPNRGSYVSLNFEVERPTAPAELNVNECLGLICDDRKLGIGLEALTFKSSERHAGSASREPEGLP